MAVALGLIVTMAVAVRLERHNGGGPWFDYHYVCGCVLGRHSVSSPWGLTYR